MCFKIDTRHLLTLVGRFLNSHIHQTLRSSLENVLYKIPRIDTECETPQGLSSSHRLWRGEQGIYLAG